MTIGVGYLCQDGVVLCSDNQITWSGSHKYYECKIYQHCEPNQWAVAFTFAGNPNLMKSFNGKFSDTMCLVPGPYTLAKLQDAIETVLSLMDVLDTDQDGLQMICAIAAPPYEMALLRTERKVVSKVQRHDYVGVGDSSLLRFLVPLLSERRASHFLADEALRVGVYLILKAKAYVDGCGGDTDAVILRPNCVFESRSNATYNIEQHMLMLEHEIKKVAEQFFDRSKTTEQFRESANRLVEKMAEEHEQMQITAAFKARTMPPSIPQRSSDRR